MNIRRFITKRYCGLRRLFLSTSRGKTEILLLGDSLTLSCYPVFLSRNLKKHGYPASIRIIAKNGVPIRGLLNLLEQKSRARRDVSLAVLLIGTNDLKNEKTFDANAFSETLNRIVSLILEYEEKPWILLCTVPVPGPHPALPADSSHIVRTVLNPLIRNLAGQQNAILCELETFFDDDPSLRTDGVHPTVEGDRLLAETIGDTILSYMRGIS